DVLRRDLVPELGSHALSPPAVSMRDGDGALGRLLPDDVAVELSDDFARREGAFSEVVHAEASSTSICTLWFVNTQMSAAMLIAFFAMLAASRSVDSHSARAAASA